MRRQSGHLPRQQKVSDTDGKSDGKAQFQYARGEPILRMTGVDGQHASAGFALP